MSGTKGWVVYLIEATTGQLYCGITTDLARRFLEHGTPKGAKFFKGKRQPKAIRFVEEHADRSSASIREAAIKKLSRAEKLVLIQTSHLDP
ncbi:MAG: GIY-YIG nuclease family protein, partial [Halobacteriovoraceae bacterium]|nr:GIY-YIG nuclease family protein [Halobacteriovoraceae bacterium]